MRVLQRTQLAFSSALRFPFRAPGALYLRRDRVGKVFQIEEAGRYRLFRETVHREVPTYEAQVLVIGFRLKWVGRSSFWHWLFQRVCIVTTPFWWGLPGFHIKLWMVEVETKEYLGIYSWQGKEESQDYLAFLIPILQFFSISDSIWIKQHEAKYLDEVIR